MKISQNLLQLMLCHYIIENSFTRFFLYRKVLQNGKFELNQKVNDVMVCIFGPLAFQNVAFRNVDGFDNALDHFLKIGLIGKFRAEK